MINNLFEPSEHLWRVWGLILNVIFSPSDHLVGASPLPLHLGYIFVGIQHSPVNGCSAVSCNFGVLTGEDKRTSFYSTFLFLLAPWKKAMTNLDNILRESIPRQVDKKSRGPQRERGMEFSRRKKGQTFSPSTFLRII